MPNKDYYKTLGVTKTASVDEIKKAYRKLALQYHPDRGGDKETEAKFKEINEAYQILSDPEKRRAFDQFGDAAFGGGNRGGGQGFGGFDFSGFSGFDESNFSGFGGGGLGDIFEEFFGASMSQVQAELAITPAQAVLGDKFNLDMSGEKLEFTLPAGTQNGVSFRFAGKGRAMRNGRKGDLILTVRVELPKNLTKEQHELWEQLKETETHKKGWWNR